MGFIMKRNVFFRNTLFLLLLLAYIVFIYSSSSTSKTSIPLMVLLQFLVIGAYSVRAIIKDKNIFSLNKMHWYFIFIFMFLSPLAQLLADYKPWNYSLNDSLMIRANWVVILWSVVYSISYASRKRLVITRNTGVQKHYSFLSLSRSTQLCLLVLSFGCLLIMVGLIGPNNLLLRGSSVLTGSTFSIMFNYLFRSIPAISCGMLLIGRKKGISVSKIIIAMLFLITLFLNSPFALSRYWVGVIYIGLALCLLSEKVFEGRKFDLYVMVGLVILFPLFYLFKNNTFSEVLHMKNIINLSDTYTSVDFDAYSMLGRIIQFVDSSGFQFGKQLRSVIFFFVPRSIWNIKGTPTGSLVAGAQGSSFTNVSAPLMGEGYIDFGIIGVIVFALVIAYIFKRLDFKYWEESKLQGLTYVQIIEPFMMGFVLFIMRGALQPSFLRLMGFFLFLILYAMFRKILNGIKRA